MALNYATWNPNDKGANCTLSGGNLVATASGGVPNPGVRSNIAVSSGKWYWEIASTSAGTAEAMIGIVDASAALSIPGADVHGWSYWGFAGHLYHSGVDQGAYGNSFTTETIGIALDADNGKVYFSKNGVWQNSADPVAGTGGVTLTGVNKPYFAMVGNVSGASNLVSTANFGATAFVNNPPSGYNRGLYGISLDSNLGTTSRQSAVSSVTQAFNNVSGDYVLVGVASDQNADSVTGVTYAGKAMTRLGAKVGVSNGESTYIYGINNPALGSNNIVISFNTSQTCDFGAVSYKGVAAVAMDANASNPYSFTSGSTSSTTETITTNSENDWMVAFSGLQRASSASTGSTQRSGNLGSGGAIYDSNGGLAAGSNSMTQNVVSGPGPVSSVGVALVPATGKIIDYLIVGAGAGGGAPQPWGGGGGAGEVTYKQNVSVSAGTFAAVVGTGGTAGANNVAGGTGGSSSFNGTTAVGGGGGAGSNGNPGNNGGSGGGGGGSGGGAGGTSTATDGVGNNGGGTSSTGGGGGGGAGAVGGASTSGQGGDGGNGISNSITGSAVTYGGGGAGNGSSGSAPTGGTGGGGNGGVGAVTGSNGTANTGGGGGPGAVGGSGVVIVRVLTSDWSSITGGTQTTSGIYTICTFNTGANLVLATSAPSANTGFFAFFGA